MCFDGLLLVFCTLSSLLEFVVTTFDPARPVHLWIFIILFHDAILIFLRLLPVHMPFIFRTFDCCWVIGRDIGWFRTCCCTSVLSLMLSGSSISMLDSISVFDHVTRWWICLVALTTLGDVVLFNVEAFSAILGDVLISILWGWPTLMMRVICFKISICLHLFSDEGTAIFIIINISLAANIVLSASDMDGSL